GQFLTINRFRATGRTIESPPTPTEDRKPAWRRACLAYREMPPTWCQRSKSTRGGRRSRAGGGVAGVTLERGQRGSHQRDRLRDSLPPRVVLAACSARGKVAGV